MRHRNCGQAPQATAGSCVCRRGSRATGDGEIIFGVDNDYREKGVPASQVPGSVVEPLIARVMSAPDERLMNIGEVVAHPLPKKVESFAGFVCDRCGEMTVEGYGRPLGDKKVCIPCYEQAMQER